MSRLVGVAIGERARQGRREGEADTAREAVSARAGKIAKRFIARGPYSDAASLTSSDQKAHQIIRLVRPWSGLLLWQLVKSRLCVLDPGIPPPIPARLPRLPRLPFGWTWSRVAGEPCKSSGLARARQREPSSAFRTVGGQQQGVRFEPLQVSGEWVPPLLIEGAVTANCRVVSSEMQRFALILATSPCSSGYVRVIGRQNWYDILDLVYYRIRLHLPPLRACDWPEPPSPVSALRPNPPIPPIPALAC